MNRRSRHALSPNGCLRRIARSVESKSTAAPFPEIGNMQSRSFLSIGAGLLLLASCGGKKFQPEGGPFVQPPPMTTPATLGVSDGALVRTAGSARRPHRHERVQRRWAGRRVHVGSGRARSTRSAAGATSTARREVGTSRKSVDAFVAGFDASWLAPIMSDDPTQAWMPPPGQAVEPARARRSDLRLRHARAGLVVRRQTQGRLRGRRRHGRRVARRRRRTTRSRPRSPRR